LFNNVLSKPLKSHINKSDIGLRFECKDSNFNKYIRGSTKKWGNNILVNPTIIFLPFSKLH